MAIITVVDEELAAVRSADAFTEYVSDTPYFFRNRLPNGAYDVVLAKCADRSNTPCTELVGELAESLRPEFIILSGIAGGVAGRDGVALGDVIIADHVEGYEMRKLEKGEDKLRRQALDHPSKYLRETIAHRVRHSDAWLSHIRTERPNAGIPKVIVGNLIAGEKILGDGNNAYQQRILSTFDKAVAVDMESHGLARGVYSARSVRHYNLNYLIVRGISDLVDDEGNNETRRLWRDYAASTAAAFTVAAANELVACCR